MISYFYKLTLSLKLLSLQRRFSIKTRNLSSRTHMFPFKSAYNDDSLQQLNALGPEPIFNERVNCNLGLTKKDITLVYIDCPDFLSVTEKVNYQFNLIIGSHFGRNCKNVLHLFTYFGLLIIFFKNKILIFLNN